MIILDLEFNNGMYEAMYFDEILQIGAVKADSLGGAVTDTFSVFVKPRVNKRLSPGARALPGLDESLDRGVPFEDAYRAWLEFAEGEEEFAEWGRDDYKILCRNAVYFGFEPAFPKRYIDVQMAFSRALDSKNTTQLYLAAEYCRVPDTFVFHDALNDALYTNLVGGCIGAGYIGESILELCEDDIFAKRQAPRKKRGKIRMGPFESRELALNNMGVRRAVCPICREVSLIPSWHTLDGTTYLGTADCAEHGQLIRRVTISTGEDGKYWTYNDIIPTNERNQLLLETSMTGDSFTCYRRHSPSSARRRKEYWKRCRMRWKKKKKKNRKKCK